MNLAIVADWLTVFGGAEHAVAEFAALNANYLMKRLIQTGYEAAYPMRRASHRQFLRAIGDLSEKRLVLHHDELPRLRVPRGGRMHGGVEQRFDLTRADDIRRERANRVAAPRHTLAISRSRLRTPASRV